MNRKIFLWGGVLLSIVLILGVMFPRPSQQVVEKIVEKLGAFPGPDISSSYLIFNGIEHKYFSTNFNTASTTVCSFRLPNATTTLITGSLSLTTATGSAMTWEFGKSTVQDATTTSLGLSVFAS